MILKKIKGELSFLIKHPDVLKKVMLFRLSPLIPSSKLYIRLQARIWKSGGGHLTNPQTFNDKLDWLKAYYHNPRHTVLADKYSVKKEVAEIIGSEYVVENYGVYKSFDDIDFDALPEKFVLKTTHDSNEVFICKDKKSFDYKRAKHVLTKSLQRDYFKMFREWPYKNIPRKIIADRFLDDHSGKELLDYKFWCFDGVPKYMYVTVKAEEVFENFYDMDYNPVDINHNFPRRNPEFDKPECFELMKELAAKLSSGIPFVRIDFFQVDGKVYFGEYTFYDWGGTRAFKTKEMNLELGKLINLPEPLN